jgi:uncharacterized protein YdbL (DUF1318 family)
MKLFVQYILVTLVVVGCVSIPNQLDVNVQIAIEHIYEQGTNVRNYVAQKSDTKPDITTAAGDQNSFVAAADPTVGMRSRYADIQAGKKAKAIGENDMGYIDFVGTDRNQESKYLKLILDENDDRKALYEGIAAAEKIDVNLIGEAYADIWK